MSLLASQGVLEGMALWRRLSGSFAISAIFTLALGIAASTAMFGVFRAVLLATIPYTDPDKVVALQTRFTTAPKPIPRLTGGDLLDIADAKDVFDSVARYNGGEIGVQLQGRAEWANTYFVSPNFFEVFDAPPLRGRIFSAADAERSAIVTVAFAQRVFGGVDQALGQIVHVDTRPYEIVGVMPAGFAVPAKAGIWIAGPLMPDNRNRTSYNYYSVARVKREVSVAAAQQRLNAMAQQLSSQFIENQKKTFNVVPLRDSMVVNVRSTVTLLMGAVVLVLLISCTNVAHLMIARAAARSRELAVRVALGAGSARIALQVLRESASIGVAGGIAGALLAFAAVRATVALAPANLPRIADARVDGWVLAFALAVSLLSSLIFGLAPVLQALRTDVQEALKSAGRGLAGGQGGRLRNVLVACEIALSFTLAVSAGLLVRSMVQLNSAELGFRTDGILVAYAHSPADTLPKARASTRFFERALGDLEQLPGVTSAGAAMGLPAGRYGSDGKYAIEGQDIRDRNLWRTAPNAGFRLASPRYFATLGIPLLAGRDFSAADQYDAPFVAIVSQSLAKRSFPGQDAVGRKIICGLDSDKWMTIVGVVADVRSGGPADTPGPELYMPFQQHPFHANELQLVVRTAGDPEALAAPLVRKMRALNPEIALQTITLNQMVYDAVAAPRFRAFLVSVFAGVALLLALAGVYGVMAYIVAQRTGELGLRMALGCAPGGVVRLVLLRAAWLAAAGLAAGALLCAVASRWIEALLYGVKGGDIAGYVIAAAAIALVTLAAASLPAWRAARIDPAIALRSE
jgi:putative ABC transport system permease protein